MIAFSKTTRTQLYQALKASFPDAKIGTSDLETLAVCLQKEQDKGGSVLPARLKSIDLEPYRTQLAQQAKSLPATETYACSRAPGDTSRYYLAKAVHVRKTHTGFEPFTGEIAMDRVTLNKHKPQTFRTAFGSIEPGDHLIATVFEANQKYQRALGYALERVDLVTPPRDVVRFGAISAYLGYRKKTDVAPSCYILEAGTATGQPKVLYLGKEIGKPINAYSGYKPTPFACPNHAYFGTLTIKNDSPDHLSISSRKVEAGVSLQPYMEVDIDWVEQTGALQNIWPGFLIVRAAAIVFARELTGKIPEDCNDTRTPA